MQAEKLMDRTGTDFLAQLAGGTPTPGGGSVAALLGALGSALAAMVAGLTSGREKYADEQALMDEVLPQLEALQGRLAALVDEDSRVYAGVSAVFKMPKDTEAQRAARKEAMQAALVACTETPLATMEAGLSALRLAARLAGHANPNAASDLGVAALALKAAVQGAWLNVLTNLEGVQNGCFIAETQHRGNAIIEEALPLADGVYEGVLEALQN